MISIPSTERKAAYTHVRQDIVALVPSEARKVLDLGCSDGTNGAVLKQLKPDRQVMGVEYSAELAAIASSRLDRVVHGSLDDERTLDALAAMRFDCVICADVLEHLVQPWATLRRLGPLLEPGATIVISLPNIRHISALMAIFWHGTFPRRNRGLFDDTHLRWFTLRNARELLGEAGFEIEVLRCALRVGDKGGGRINRLLNRWLGPTAPKIAPVREFLTYQFELRARCVRP